MLCCAVLCCNATCRLSCLSSVSIDLVSDSESGGTAADVEPVLAHMLTHATGLRCLQLKPNTDWAGYDATWVSLARLVALTRLELDFGDYVSLVAGLCWHGSATQGTSNHTMSCGWR